MIYFKFQKTNIFSKFKKHTTDFLECVYMYSCIFVVISAVNTIILCEN